MALSLVSACSGHSGVARDAAADVMSGVGGAQGDRADGSGTGGFAGEGTGRSDGGGAGRDALAEGGGGAAGTGGVQGGRGGGGGAAGIGGVAGCRGGGGGAAGAGGSQSSGGGASDVTGGKGGTATGGGSVGVIAIAAGGNDSCAIRADHTVFCRGDNTSRQLGDKKLGFANAAAISVAGDHTCALTRAGEVYC